MQNKPLPKLPEELEQELLRLGYTEGSLKFYRRRWKMLLDFAKFQGEDYFSEQLGIDFAEKHFNILERDFQKTLSQKDTQELRVIRMVGDFQLHHSVLRRYYKDKEVLTDPYYIRVSEAFQSYCREKGYSGCTIDYYVKQSAYFMDYLASQEISNCNEIALELINRSICTLAGYSALSKN